VFVGEESPAVGGVEQPGERRLRVRRDQAVPGRCSRW
jgi:hypothetical protein